VRVRHRGLHPRAATLAAAGKQAVKDGNTPSYRRHLSINPSALCLPSPIYNFELFKNGADVDVGAFEDLQSVEDRLLSRHWVNQPFELVISNVLATSAC
jgi:hypothetical protein